MKTFYDGGWVRVDETQYEDVYEVFDLTDMSKESIGLITYKKGMESPKFRQITLPHELRSEHLHEINQACVRMIHERRKAHGEVNEREVEVDGVKWTLREGQELVTIGGKTFVADTEMVSLLRELNAWG